MNFFRGLIGMFFCFFAISPVFANASSVEHEIASKFSQLQCPTLQDYSCNEIDDALSKAFPDGSFDQKWSEELKGKIAEIDPAIKIENTPPKGILVLPREYAHYTVSKNGEERSYILVFFPGSSGVLCEEKR